MLNWRALGEPKRAASSQTWFYVSIGMLAVYVFMALALANSKTPDGGGRGLSLLFLITWYFASAKSQSKYVKAKWGVAYPRRPWGRALLVGCGAVVGYLVLAVIVALIVGAATRT